MYSDMEQSIRKRQGKFRMADKFGLKLKEIFQRRRADSERLPMLHLHSTFSGLYTSPHQLQRNVVTDPVDDSQYASGFIILRRDSREYNGWKVRKLS